MLNARGKAFGKDPSAERPPRPTASGCFKDSKATLENSMEELGRGQISAETAARLFHSWENARKIVLAVSGGPDSVALMLLAAQWARQVAPFDPGAHLHVATVDHGLRDGSRGEAERVASWAGGLGLAHDILVWEGVKPTSKIQERAREARYGLLFSFAGRIGADVVATAHHADDQAETILFRLLRGSGLGGLSGMAANVERQALILSRPLLQCSKTQLIAVCEAIGHPFCADPSNDNPAYARTKMRALCGLLAEEGLNREALLRLGRRAARADAALAEWTRAATASLAPMRGSGGFAANISCLAAAPEEIFLRVIACEIQALGSNTHPLRLERLERLTTAMQQALRASEPFNATLGGAVLRLRRDRTLTIKTENPRRRCAAGPRNLSDR
jgi:tRNA(Ile)-lysidine synthase